MQRHSKQLINLNWNAVNPKWHELNPNPTNPKRIIQGKYPKHNKAQWNKPKIKQNESKKKQIKNAMQQIQMETHQIQNVGSKKYEILKRKLGGSSIIIIISFSVLFSGRKDGDWGWELYVK